jgi:hypothetical protein
VAVEKEKWYDKLFNVKYLPLFHHFKAIYQFPKQALVSFKKYMPPPLPYFKVNICPLSLPHFASISFAYL